MFDHGGSPSAEHGRPEQLAPSEQSDHERARAAFIREREEQARLAGERQEQADQPDHQQERAAFIREREEEQAQLADGRQAEQARLEARRQACAAVVGPELPDDPEERRARLHADLDALLDAQRTDPGTALAGALVGWDRLQRAIDGSLVATVAGFDRSAEWALDAHRSSTAWLVASVGLKRAAAGSLRSVCDRVADHPVLAAAAAEGRLSLDHLRALLAARSAPVVDAFDEEAEALAAAAGRMSVDALRRHLERWRLDVLARLGRNEPDGPEPDDPTGSTCRVVDLLWGRARVDLDLDPVAAAELKAGLEREYEAMRRAGALDEDPRALAEIMGELFVAIWRRGVHRDGASALVPLISATVDLDTLLARAGEADPAGRARRIAEIAGHGPVSDEVIAELAARANVALLVTDRTGAPLWYGRSRRLATPAQRSAAIAGSDGHCSFPGCTIGAERCEIDHLLGWTSGGPTDIDNLAPICSFHNRLKHRWGILVARGPDGELRWRRRDGRPLLSRYQTTSGPPPPGRHQPPGGPEDDGSPPERTEPPPGS